MVTISAGSGTSGMGGALSLLSGRSTAHTGGSVSIESGEGYIDEQRCDRGAERELGATGASGRLVFSSGSAASGNSGALYLGSGAAAGGRGGMVSISVGSGTSGSGGAVSVLSGRSTVHSGGALSLESGEGTATSSGVISIRTANAGGAGVSGRLVFSSGSASGRKQRRAVCWLGRGDWWPWRHGEHQRWQRHKRVGRCRECPVGPQHGGDRRCSELAERRGRRRRRAVAS